MKKTLKLFFIVFVIFGTNIIYGQNEGVSINTTNALPDQSAILDVSATNKGVLIPRVNIQNLTDASAPVNNPLPSLLVYNTNITTGVGYYYWSGSEWKKLITDLPDNSSINEIQDLSLNGYILTLTNDNTNVDLSNLIKQDYALLKLSTNQNTGIGVDLPVKFDVINGNLTLNGAGRIVLNANKTYKLQANLYIEGSAANSQISTGFFNLTSNQYFGVYGQSLSVSYLSYTGEQTSAIAIITTTQQTEIELRIRGFENISYINGDYSFILIEEIK